MSAVVEPWKGGAEKGADGRKAEMRNFVAGPGAPKKCVWRSDQLCLKFCPQGGGWVILQGSHRIMKTGKLVVCIMVDSGADFCCTCANGLLGLFCVVSFPEFR